jgi:hypothetical protein
MSLETDPFDASRYGTEEIPVGNGINSRPPKHKPGEKFLKGPIPWDWLEALMQISGETWKVALLIWLESGYRKSRTVPFNLSHSSLVRRTAQRGLQQLMKAGLVKVEHRRGRPSLVTLLDASSQ